MWTAFFLCPERTPVKCKTAIQRWLCHCTICIKLFIEEGCKQVAGGQFIIWTLISDIISVISSRISGVIPL